MLAFQLLPVLAQDSDVRSVIEICLDRISHRDGQLVLAVHGEHEDPASYGVEVLVIAQVLEPAPDGLFSVGHDGGVPEVFEASVGDASLGRAEFVEDISLKLTLSQILSNTLIEPSKLCIAQFSVQQHVELSKYVLDS